MRLGKVAVLGGGPGGLYVARLLKLAQPDCQVDLYEQGTPETTFGFGVGLAAGTQRTLRDADADSLDAILSLGYPHDMSLRVGSDVAALPNPNLRAIGRTALLNVLEHHAVAADVRMHFGERVEVDSLDAELVIAADGVSSTTRDNRSADFGVQIDIGEALYLWCGTNFALPRAMFMPVTTEAGTFVTHAYPYAADRSTFLVETDETTWRAAGFDVTTEALATAPADASDDRSLSYLSGAFADPLEGHPLIGNRTRWQQFRGVRCERWHLGHLVLLGDAAHTAHYSIGSGTKLAMEDAIALVAALGEQDTVAAALTHYEQARRPAVEHLQDVAVRSQRWWDTFPTRLALPVHQLLVSYMTRAGKVSLNRFAETTPSAVTAAVTEYCGRSLPEGGDLPHFVVAQPLAADGQKYPNRLAPPTGPVVVVEFTDPDPWGPKADAALAFVDDAVADGATAVRVTGPDARDDVLNRLDLAERLRQRMDVLVTVQAPAEHLPDLAAGLLAGRTDLIEPS